MHVGASKHACALHPSQLHSRCMRCTRTHVTPTRAPHCHAPGPVARAARAAAPAAAGLVPAAPAGRRDAAPAAPPVGAAGQPAGLHAAAAQPGAAAGPRFLYRLAADRARLAAVLCCLGRLPAVPVAVRLLARLRGCRHAVAPGVLAGVAAARPQCGGGGGCCAALCFVANHAQEGGTNSHAQPLSSAAACQRAPCVRAVLWPTACAAAFLLHTACRRCWLASTFSSLSWAACSASSALPARRCCCRWRPACWCSTCWCVLRAWCRSCAWCCSRASLSPASGSRAACLLAVCSSVPAAGSGGGRGSSDTRAALHRLPHARRRAAVLLARPAACWSGR